MAKKWIKEILVFLFCVVLINKVYSDESKLFTWDFSGCEIKDILYAISVDTGISIVTDDTVDGTGDLKFSGSDFEIAFDSFLSSARLYVEKKENIWTVSRCSIRYENGRYSLDVCDMSPAMILEKISLKMDKVITYDTLPASKMSVHFRDLSDVELFESLAKRFGSFEVIQELNSFHFAKKVNVHAVNMSKSCMNLLLKNDGSIVVDLRDALFSEVIDSLFEKACRNDDFGFCLLSGSDVRIQRCNFVADNFEEALREICALNGFSTLFEKNIYYILSDSKVKNDVVFGERQWQKFFLKYTSTETIIPVLNSRIKNLETNYIHGQPYLFACVNSKEVELIQKIIEEIDVKNTTYVIDLKYLKPAEIVEKLPPSVKKEKIFYANDSSCIYFSGTEEEYENLCEEIENIDKSVKRISYDLLILQYDEGKQNEWISGVTADSLSMGDRNCISGQIGSVFNLNLNVLSTFGLNFASSLQASIEDNSTNVFADTTIHGVSGKKINFQNTNTYRYRDNNLDPETGKPVYSGITKEIISGITIDILGWVSGNNMVTSTVTAKVSRQGNDLSSLTGNPPPTSEKTITTEVCCKSGEPVILSGLLQNSKTMEEKRTPVFSKIPLIGELFKSKEKTTEKSQMIIYLVPHVDDAEEESEVFTKKNDEWAKNQINKLLEGSFTGENDE